jgi:hypothetical protein
MNNLSKPDFTGQHIYVGMDIHAFFLPAAGCNVSAYFGLHTHTLNMTKEMQLPSSFRHVC